MKGAILFSLLVALAMTGCGQNDQCLDSQARDSESGSPTAQLPDTTEAYGALGALSRDNLTLLDMLTFAIQDEHLAEAEYIDVLARHGNIRPFSNIVNAERRHIEALEPLFRECGEPIPDNEGAQHVIPTETIEQALDACVEGEINNIAMYELFLDQDGVPENVREVFSNLKAASEQHLQAFRRNRGD